MVMNNIRFKKEEQVILEGIIGTSVIEAVCEAKRFCIDNKLTDVELTCNGFDFLIVPETDILDELRQFYGSSVLFGRSAEVMTAFNDIIRKCDETTSGNVSHKTRTIKGIASNMLEIINKNIG